MYSFSEFQNKFHIELEKHIKKEFALYKNYLGTYYKEYSNMWEYIKPLSQKGKRIRPYACYVAYAASGGKDIRKIMNLCLALELLHISFLVHDDIMDGGTERHGIKTAHIYFSERVKKKVKNTEHFGESQALLLGDILIQWSAKLFTQNAEKFSPPTSHYITKLYFDMMGETMIGQGIDLTLTTKHKVKNGEIDLKNYFKTANYTFIRPFQIGAGIATKGDTLEVFYKKLGENLGFLFQVQDDLLDILGDPKKTKKSIFTDIKTGQHTFFTQYIFNRGTAKEKQILKKYFGKAYITKKDEQVLRDLFYDSGAIAYGEKIMQIYTTKAEILVANQKKLKNKAILYNLLGKLKERSS